MGCFFSNSKKTKDVMINLFDVNVHDVPYFTLKGGIVKAKVIDIHDGDTLTLMFVHEGKVFRFRCICAGYKAASLHPRRDLPNRDEIITEAKIAKARLMELLHYGKRELVSVHLGDFDSFGRILVKLYTNYDLKSVNQIMIDEGLVEKTEE